MLYEVDYRGFEFAWSAIFTLKKVILKSFRVPYSYVILYVFLYVIYKIKKPTLQLVVLIFEKFLFL